MTPETIVPPTGQRKPGLVGWLVLAPLLLWLAAFVIAPTIIVLVYSFCTRRGQAEVALKFTWDNYRQILDDPSLWLHPVVSLIVWTIIGILIGAAAGALAFLSAWRRDFWYWSGLALWGAIFLAAMNLRLSDSTTAAALIAEIRTAGFLWTIAIGALAGELLGWIFLKVWPVHGAIHRLIISGSLILGMIFLIISLHMEIFGIPIGRAVHFKLFWRAVEYALMTTGICVIAGYPVAYFIGRASDAWRNRLLLLVMIPFWTSFLIRTLAWLTILAEEGPLNSLLLQLKWLDKPFSALGTPFAVVLGLVYTYLPFMILPIYGSVEKLDHSLVEAAMDLGASPVRAFAKVILPMTRPGIFAGILLVFIPSLGMYAIADLMGGDNSRTRTIGRIIEEQFIGKAGNWPYGCALGMAIMLLFAVSYGATRRQQT